MHPVEMLIYAKVINHFFLPCMTVNYDIICGLMDKNKKSEAGKLQAWTSFFGWGGGCQLGSITSRALLLKSTKYITGLSWFYVQMRGLRVAAASWFWQVCFEGQLLG